MLKRLITPGREGFVGAFATLTLVLTVAFLSGIADHLFADGFPAAFWWTMLGAAGFNATMAWGAAGMPVPVRASEAEARVRELERAAAREVAHADLMEREQAAQRKLEAAFVRQEALLETPATRTTAGIRTLAGLT